MKWRLALSLMVLTQAAEAFADEVTSLAVTPDGRTLIAAGMDGRVRVVDLSLRRERASVLAHKGGVWAMGLSAAGQHFITGGADQSARIWDLARVKEVRAHEGHTAVVSAVALSADGRLAASGRLRRVGPPVGRRHRQGALRPCRQKATGDRPGVCTGRQTAGRRGCGRADGPATPGLFQSKPALLVAGRRRNQGSSR